ncbi:MAG: acyl-CoA desaturase [Mycolicibacter sinensis]
MAISQVGRYAHLSESDVEALGLELDAIRRGVEASLGARDAAYIHRTIVFQRLLDVAARVVIHRSKTRLGWMLGTAALAVAKCIENMEIGHNVTHGQWDWMNDPEIHSNTWEWDMTAVSAQWRYSHNYSHHVFTNIIGMDEDMGFGIMRVSRDQPWGPGNLLQPLANLVLAVGFQWGVALHTLASGRSRARTDAEKSAATRTFLRKAARQVTKEYLLFPALGGQRWRRTFAANAGANLIRNVWAYLVIFCGHFPDGAEKFDPAVLERETRSEWYLRQMLGSANFDAGPVLGYLSGNLCYQIEHHLFPDLPSNRLPEIAVQVRALCEKYDLPYTTGPLPRQYLMVARTIVRLALPDPQAAGPGARRHRLRTALKRTAAPAVD